MIRIVTACIAGLLLLQVARPAAGQDFDAGLSAYAAADYDVAFAQWLPLALEGDARAQASLGFLYLKGLRVRQDDALAAKWYRLAAEDGQPEAQFFLGTLYFLGRGVPQNFVEAYLWCELALSNGMTEGLDCRSEAALHMTRGQLAEADRRLVEWRSARR